MAATILDGEKGGKRRSEKDDRPWVGPCMLAGSYSIDATPDLLYRSTYLLVLLRIQNAAGSSYTRLACVGVTKPVDATLHGVANPSGRRTRACHPSSLASPQVDRRACHADAGAPGAQGPARTRTAATAVQLARGFCSIDRSIARRPASSMAAHARASFGSWLASGVRAPGPLPFPRKGLGGQCPARTKGAGTRGRVLRWLTLR